MTVNVPHPAPFGNESGSPVLSTASTTKSYTPSALGSFAAHSYTATPAVASVTVMVLVVEVVAPRVQ